ncbi:hypothetical protein ACFLQU_03635 [Verrucomicrobiota bacterium]
MRNTDGPSRWDAAARNGRGTAERMKCLRHLRRRFCRPWLVAVASVLMALPASAGGQGDGQYELELAGVLPNARALTLMLDVRGGKVASAFALGRKYNGRGHIVDAAGVTVADRRIIGPVNVTIIPDPWVPRDHKERTCKLELDVVFQEAGATGKYVGTYDGEERKGVVTGKKLPNAGREGRYKLKMFQALRRLKPTPWWGGGNATYAIDMWLTFRVDKRGRAVDAQLESPVPDYRRYCALVRSIDVDFDGAEFRATVKADVDHGGQAQKKKDARREKYEYELRGAVIGNDVVGRYDGEVAEIHDKDIPFMGSVDRGPIPDPNSATVFMRLHTAMQSEFPVLLYLSVSDPRHIHGLAYAPGYNHQPHAVDCTRLERKGNRIEGPMVVSIYPDCYHSQTVFFDMKYELDAEIERGVVNGKFKGEDRGKDTKGVITGELRPKKPPVAGPKGLAAYELSVGWAMAKAKSKSIVVRYELEDGKLSKTAVLDAKTKKPMDVEIKNSDIKVNGDQINASVIYEMTGKGAGKYEFSFSAKIDGDRCGGFWRGRHNGENILVKSAKSGGRLVAK